MVVAGYQLQRVTVWKKNGHYQAVAYWLDPNGEERLTFGEHEKAERSFQISLLSAEGGHFRKPNRV